MIIVKYEFSGALPNQKIILSKKCLIEEANCVLIFAFYQGKLVLVRHHARGWELPGGTREEGESIIQTVIREMYEEAGGELASIETVGQYLIFEKDQLVYVKNIYIAKVSILRELPVGYETNGIMLLDTIPEQFEIMNDPTFSSLMKDNVYLIVSEWIKDHRLNELTKTAK
ncbi:Putative 8-oxo-dGTP diphosphatase YtkD [Paenibacillus allorhizoplanae]|uniref:8-oxo-dGTP diphosphatase YtkD n=1 Tax=Paenibacillus allorhizoplanae TaxID=2905648 RepID=A0ABM9CDF4_9BACL|nr:NUDIX domain-containing protein [Paenibacillus allorhizoplanae]CAH1210632.1 Putative 8-oxo-dGTP diphosphatase YtkD [Paenibacillus allorhizoplanae]